MRSLVLACVLSSSVAVVARAATAGAVSTAALPSPSGEAPADALKAAIHDDLNAVRRARYALRKAQKGSDARALRKAEEGLDAAKRKLKEDRTRLRQRLRDADPAPPAGRSPRKATPEPGGSDAHP